MTENVIGKSVKFVSRLLIPAALVALSILALALLRPDPSDTVQVQLRRLLRVERDPPRPSADAPDGLIAEFQIQVPSQRKIWLTDWPIGVEILTERRDWTWMSPEGRPTQGFGSRGGRTISRSIWLALPANVKSGRLTIGFRRQTRQELVAGLLDKSRLSRRFPAISAWIIQHLSTTEHWQVCRREVPVTPSSIKLETYHRAPSQTNAPPTAHVAAPSIDL